MPHQGEILQEAIKNSGISITRIVDELGITRPTIYRKFKDDTLDYGFVKRVGEIIGHDFSSDFTSLQQSVLPFAVNSVTNSVTNSPVKPVLHRSVTSPTVDPDIAKQLMQLQQKYIALLEAYNDLLLKVYGPR
ncbi:helix-turn-helix domain-containing protein [Hymenobacter rigui]|nr:helix-turn-helix domain-containing protein [Hymenobacter rigui]